MIELVVSSVLLGALLGALYSGFLVNVRGRRYIIQMDSIIFLIGTVISSCATSVIILMVGRVLVGFGIGVASYIIPLYISELSPARYRGGFVALNTIAVTGGIFISYLVGYLLSPMQSWNYMLGVGVIPAIFLWIGTHFLPETPRWLVKQGKWAEAMKVLRSLRANEQEVQTEMEEIQKNLKTSQTALKELFHPKIRKVFFLGMILATIQQVTGINVILYYAPLIFKAFGFESDSSSFLLTLVVGFTNFLMTIITVFKVDKIGRRALLLYGLAGMTLSLVVLSVSLHYDLQSLYTKGLIVFALFSFVSCYACSIGCVFWIVISEIYPLNIRGVGMGFASAMNWFSNLCITITFLSLVNVIGMSNTFLCYAMSGFFSFLYCYYFLPETAQVSLETIEARNYE